MCEGKQFDFSFAHLCCTLCENFHSVTVKDTSCNVRHMARFEISAHQIKLVLTVTKYAYHLPVHVCGLVFLLLGNVAVHSATV